MNRPVIALKYGHVLFTPYIMTNNGWEGHIMAVDTGGRGAIPSNTLPTQKDFKNNNI